MADGSSTYLQDQRLNVVKGTNHVAAPANLYVSLWRTDPLDDGSGTEETGTGYARIVIASGGWSAISSSGGGRIISNSADIGPWTVGAGGWGTTIGWAGLHSAITAGNLWYYYAFTNGAVDLSTVGGTFLIPAGSFVIQEGD